MSGLRGYVLSSLTRGEQADAVLADIPAGELSDAERSRLVFLQAANRLFNLADPAGATKLIDDAEETTPPHARKCIDAFFAVYWAAMGKPDMASQASKHVVWDKLPDVVARYMAWARAVAAGDAGRTAEAVAAAQAGYPVPVRPVRGFVIIADSHVGALLLAGHIAQAQEVTDWLGRLVADVSGPGRLYSGPLAGRAALGAGRLDTACSLLGPVAQALAASAVSEGWGNRCQISLVNALATCGRSEEAAAAYRMLEKHRHPAWQYLDYEYAIATAWVAACRGAVTEAIKTLKSAAEPPDPMGNSPHR